MKTLTVKVPDDLDRELERAAGERGASKSVLVRLAIRELLDRSAEAGQGSFLAAGSSPSTTISRSIAATAAR